jgi:hypothetical protein
MLVCMMLVISVRGVRILMEKVVNMDISLCCRMIGMWCCMMVKGMLRGLLKLIFEENYLINYLLIYSFNIISYKL